MAPNLLASQRTVVRALLLFVLFQAPSAILALVQDNPQDLCPAQLQPQQISIVEPLADKLSEIISSHWQGSGSPGMNLPIKFDIVYCMFSYGFMS
jgi:hypothetical protein